MTFAAAVWCPYPFAPNLPRTGLVLIADTRFVYEDEAGRQLRPPNDAGMKLAPVGSHAGVAWAGEVDPPVAVIPRLVDFFRTTPRPCNDPRTTERLDECLTAADHDGGVPSSSKYSMLIGFIDDAGSPRVVVVGQESQKVHPAQPVEWGKTVGQRQHQDLFVEALHQLVEQRVRDHASAGMRLSLGAQEWALLPALALKTGLIDSKIDKSVGGGIQIAWIDASGYHPGDVYAVPIGDNQAPWTRITPDVTL